MHPHVLSQQSLPDTQAEMSMKAAHMKATKHKPINQALQHKKKFRFFEVFFPTPS